MKLCRAGHFHHSVHDAARCDNAPSQHLWGHGDVIDGCPTMKCERCGLVWWPDQTTPKSKCGAQTPGAREGGRVKLREGDQGLPVVNESIPVQDQVLAYIERRKAIGIERYGTALQANNGRDALRDLFEELVDAVNYCAQMLIERDGKLP